MDIAAQGDKYVTSYNTEVRTIEKDIDECVIPDLNHQMVLLRCSLVKGVLLGEFEQTNT